MRFIRGLGVGVMLLVAISLPTGCNSLGGVVGAVDQPDDAADAGSADVAADALPDFSAPDVNETSARFGQDVSPSDYLQQVSAWYFGHST